jgi:Recombination endonuclease VII
MPPDHKQCRVCRELKPVSDFCLKRHGRHGLDGCCKPCHRQQTAAWRAQNPELVKRYNDRTNARVRGEFVQTKEAIAAFQANRCAICGTQAPGNGGWHLDHDGTCQKHPNGRLSGSRHSARDAVVARCSCVRGVLCARCNHALGWLESTDGLLLPGPAIERYLANPPAQIYFVINRLPI